MTRDRGDTANGDAPLDRLAASGLHGHLTTLGRACRSAWAILLLGCASTLDVPVGRPPTGNVAPVRRVAVAPFEGPENELFGIPFAEAIAASGTFEVCPPQVWQAELRLATAHLPPRDAAVAAAARLGLDGVFLGTVAAYVAEEVDESYDLFGGGKSGDSSNAGDSGGFRLRMSGDIVQRVEMQLDAELWSCREQRSVERETVRRTWKRKAETVADKKDIDAVAAKYRQECLDALLRKFAFHTELAAVRLVGDDWSDRGNADLRAGRERARAGDWTGAAERWEIAAQALPKRADLWFSLGWAHLASGRPDRAEACFLNAENLDYGADSTAALGHLRRTRDWWASLAPPAGSPQPVQPQFALAGQPQFAQAGQPQFPQAGQPQFAQAGQPQFAQADTPFPPAGFPVGTFPGQPQPSPFTPPQSWPTNGTAPAGTTYGP